MHYYKRNIGDYHKRAGRLSMIEHGAYTLLTDACYDRERFPTLEEAIDWLWAKSDEEIAAIEGVLTRFFTLQDDGTYTQEEIQKELDNYHARAETNQRIAQEREAARRAAKSKKKAKTPTVNDSLPVENESCLVVNEAPPNQEPLTTNHKPLTKNQELSTTNQEPVLELINFWNDNNGKENATVKLETWEKKIRARLETFSVDDIKTAMLYVINNKWHQDENQVLIKNAISSDERCESAIASYRQQAAAVKQPTALQPNQAWSTNSDKSQSVIATVSIDDFMENF